MIRPQQTLDSSGSIAWEADPAVDSKTGLSNQIDLCPQISTNFEIGDYGH